MPCKRELDREARIILQTMLRNEHYIKKLPLAEVALYQVRAGQKIFVKKLPVNLVEYMAKNNWLKCQDDVYNFTQLGKQWVSGFIYFFEIDRENDIDKPQLSSNLQFAETSATPEILDMMMVNSDCEYSPLLKLFNRQKNLAQKYLTPLHLQAGQKIFEHYLAANMQPNITMNWERLSAPPQPHYTGAKETGHSEQAYIAQRKLYESLKYVGQEFAAILVEICLFGKGLEATEKAMNWPARSGKLLLVMALDRLAIHYQMAPQENNDNKYLSWAKNRVGTSG